MPLTEQQSIWYVHAVGPDDEIDQPDELTALRYANSLNKIAERERRKFANDPNYPYYIAIARRRTEAEPETIKQMKQAAEAATEGPYYVSFDDAEECGPHANSGLAMVDTGRESDWPIARLCEWPNAKFIALCSPANVLELIAENESLRKALIQPTGE